MSISEKLLTIAENEQKVYNAGYVKGKSEGGDTDAAYEQGKAEGIEQGTENEKKRFWSIFLNRTAFLYAFYQWRVDNIDPQFDVIPQNASNMFNSVIAYNGKNLNIPEVEARNDIKFDFSKCTIFSGMMSWGAVEDIGFVDMRAGTSGTNSAFSNNSNLKRLSIAIKEDGSQNFSGAFDYTNILEDFTIVSGYFGSNLNFQYCKLLSVKSMASILTHLKNYYGSADAYTRTILFDNDCWDRLNSADPLSVVEDYGDYQSYIVDVLCWNT